MSTLVEQMSTLVEQMSTLVEQMSTLGGANVNPSGANVNPSGANVNPMWIHVIKRHWIQKLKCYRLLKHDYNWIGSRSIRYVKHT